MFESLFRENKIKTLRDLVVWNLSGDVKDYAEWYADHGIYLPEEFSHDPSQWTEVLRKISRAFELRFDEIKGEGELFEARNRWAEFGEVDAEKLKELEQEVQEGFELFGKYLNVLTDTTR